MNSMEEDLLRLEMDQTLKQAEEALDQIRKDNGQAEASGLCNDVVKLAPQTADLFARCLSVGRYVPGPLGGEQRSAWALAHGQRPVPAGDHGRYGRPPCAKGGHHDRRTDRENGYAHEPAGLLHALLSKEPFIHRLVQIVLPQAPPSKKAAPHGTARGSRH